MIKAVISWSLLVIWSTKAQTVLRYNIAGSVQSHTFLISNVFTLVCCNSLSSLSAYFNTIAGCSDSNENRSLCGPRQS